MNDYQLQLMVPSPPERLYQALTRNIPQWWSAWYEGAAHEAGACFTVRFGQEIYKTLLVKALFPDRKVAWQVADAQILMPGLQDPHEWIGTQILWDLIPQGNGTLLHLTHQGLHQDFGCYEICVGGWQQFVHSLAQWATTGTGFPFRQSAKDLAEPLP